MYFANKQAIIDFHKADDRELLTMENFPESVSIYFDQVWTEHLLCNEHNCDLSTDYHECISPSERNEAEEIFSCAYWACIDALGGLVTEISFD